jgi:hypothetical protein
VNNPIEIFCEACQKEASIPHGQPLVCPHCQGDAIADPEAEPTIETSAQPAPPQAPPPQIPPPPQLMTEAQMTIALLRSIKDGVDTIKMLMIIFAILTFIGALMIQGNAPRSRW